ncbi:MAG: prepilin-type N-terminal cleavage/methylation domain-containing protein [Candidatus Omnitrophica bacterium]|nr:prepilin-type N-terminal cleavage/methylation domain-containing protein [Candidatus Omnitrophota bacterium]
MHFCEPMRIKGFTLIEVLLVAILLGIVAVLSLPNFVVLQRGSVLKNKAMECAGLFREAQNLALTRSAVFRLVADSDGAVWGIEAAVDPTDLSHTAYKKIPGKTWPVFDTAAKLEVQTQGFPVVFFSDGRISPAEISLCQETACYLLSTKEERAQITVSQWTKE